MFNIICAYIVFIIYLLTDTVIIEDNLHNFLWIPTREVELTSIEHHDRTNQMFILRDGTRN